MTSKKHATVVLGRICIVGVRYESISPHLRIPLFAMEYSLSLNIAGTAASSLVEFPSSVVNGWPTIYNLRANSNEMT